MSIFKKDPEKYLEQYRTDHILFDDFRERKLSVEETLDAILSDSAKNAYLLPQTRDLVASWTKLIGRYNKRNIDSFLPGLRRDLEEISLMQDRYEDVRKRTETMYNHEFNAMIAEAGKNLAKKESEAIKETRQRLDTLANNAHALHDIISTPKIAEYSGKARERQRVQERFVQLEREYTGREWKDKERNILEKMTRETGKVIETAIKSYAFDIASSAEQLAYMQSRHLAEWDSIQLTKREVWQYQAKAKDALLRRDNPEGSEIIYALYKECRSVESKRPAIADDSYLSREVRMIEEIDSTLHARINELRTMLCASAQQEISAAKKLLQGKSSSISEDAYLHDLKNCQALRNAAMYAELGIDALPLTGRLEEAISSITQKLVKEKRMDVPLLERHIYYDRTVPKFDLISYFLREEPVTAEGKKLSAILLGEHDPTWRDKMLSLKEAIDHLPERTLTHNLNDLQKVYTGLFESAHSGNLGRSMRSDIQLQSLTELVVRKLYSYIEYQGGHHVTSACTA
jgi:hypothetical protein